MIPYLLAFVNRCVTESKKLYNTRAIKTEPVSSVGIGFNHTPIMDGTSSNISISDLFRLVKTCDIETVYSSSAKR